MKIDLHIHSCYSKDALSTPRSIIRRIRERQLDGIAITDHDNCRAWPELVKLGKREKLLIIKGEEIKVKEGKRTVGEVIGLFMNKEVKPASFGEVVDSLDSQGAMAVIPHPFDWFRTPFRNLDSAIKRVKALEVFNSRCIFSSMNLKAERYAREHNMLAVAGSDAHVPLEIGNAYVECKAQSEEELRKAILKNKAKIFGTVTSPLIHVFSPIARLGLIKKL